MASKCVKQRIEGILEFFSVLNLEQQNFTEHNERCWGGAAAV